MCCHDLLFVFFFKQKTAYEMRISDWSSDVCSSDLSQRRTFSVSSALAAGTGPGALATVSADRRRVATYECASAPAGITPAAAKIGRASCRERVCQYV